MSADKTTIHLVLELKTDVYDRIVSTIRAHYPSANELEINTFLAVEAQYYINNGCPVINDRPSAIEMDIANVFPLVDEYGRKSWLFRKLYEGGNNYTPDTIKEGLKKLKVKDW